MLDKVDQLDRMLWRVSHCKATGLSYSSWSEIMPITHVSQQISAFQLRNSGLCVCGMNFHSTNSSRRRSIKSATYFLLLLICASRTFLLSLLLHYHNFRHPYYCTGITLTHQTCLLVAHSFSGGSAAHPPECVWVSPPTQQLLCGCLDFLHEQELQSNSKKG